MITLKQVEKDEQWAITVIKTFFSQYPVIAWSGILIIALILFISIGMVMMLAGTGGGCIEKTLYDKYQMGDLTLKDLSLTLFALNTAYIFYEFITVVLDFIFAGIICILFYISFKQYLKYKRDNL